MAEISRTKWAVNLKEIAMIAMKSKFRVLASSLVLASGTTAVADCDMITT